ncbi:MAG: hypothetical protein ACO1O1_06280 [Adhaeribacter sp.]
MTKKPFFLPNLTTACGLFLLLSVFSCSSDKSTTENTETTATKQADKKAAPPAAPTSIPQVNVFLEVSGSMKGFMPSDQSKGITEFQKTLDPFLAGIQQNSSIGGRSYFEVREKPYPLDYDKISQTVRYGIKQSASSTTIPAILDSIITGHPGLNVLISDFIYSPENGRAVSFVSTDIYRVLAKARQQRQAVSVFAATSDFRGSFYPAVKTASATISPCCEAPVPYYVWVIGEPALVRLFNKEVVGSTFAEELHTGFSFAAPRFAVLDKYLPAGSWYCSSPADCKQIVISDLAEPAQLVVGLNLGELPPAFASEAYLSKHLKLTAENTDARITRIYPADRFRQLPGVADKNSDPLKPYTHFVQIKLSKLQAPQAELRLQLGRQRPDWVQAWTTADDSRPNQEGGKTFNLSGIVDGLERAFAAGAAGSLFDIALTVQQEK